MLICSYAAHMLTCHAQCPFAHVPICHMPICPKYPCIWTITIRRPLPARRVEVSPYAHMPYLPSEILLDYQRSEYLASLRNISELIFFDQLLHVSNYSVILKRVHLKRGPSLTRPFCASAFQFEHSKSKKSRSFDRLPQL